MKIECYRFQAVNNVEGYIMATLISTGRTWVSSNKTGAAPSRGGEWQWGARPDGPDEASQTKPDLSRLIWPVIETDNPQGGRAGFLFLW